MNVYEIFTKITMQNAASGVLAVLAKEVLSLEGGIVKLNKAFAEMGRTSVAMFGGLGIAAGGGMVYGMKKLTDQAKELSHELVEVQKLGISAAQFNQAQAWAYSMHGKVPGVTSVDALKVYGQIWSPLGHENALKMGQKLLEFSQVLGNTTGNYEGAVDKIFEMVRAGDLMGKFMNKAHHVDTSSLQRFLDLGARVVLATHGKVTADTWFQMAQQGGPALSGMTDKGLLTMAIVAQYMKGPRAGTALMSLFQQMTGGIMTQWRAQELKELGLVGNYHPQRGGHLTWDKGALDTPFTRAFSKDPAAGVKILVDALKAHGITDQDEQVKKLYSLFQRQTSIREIHELLRNLPQVVQERERLEKALGVGPSLNLQNTKDYIQVMQNLDAAWTEMIMHISLPLSIAAIPMMKSIGSFFDQIGEFAKKPENAKIISIIGTGIVALGAALVTGGAAAILLAMGPIGWLVGGITALGIAYLKYGDDINKHLSDLSIGIYKLGKSAWAVLVDWLVKFGNAVDKLTHIGFDWLADKFNALGDAIMNLFNKLGSWWSGRAAPTSFQGGGIGEGITNAVWTSGGGGSIGRGGGIGGSVGRSLGGIGGGGGGGIAGGAGSSVYDAIMRAEGTAGPDAYNTVLGKGAYGLPSKPLTSMTLDEAYAFGRTVRARHGSSSALGAFQIVGQTMRAAMAGLGLHGSDMFSPENQRKMAEWILHKQGLGAWEGFKSHPRELEAARRGIQPYRKHEKPPIIENTMYLDGEVVHRSVVKRMIKGMTHPTTAPYHDGSRHWTPPDAGLVGV